MLSERLINAGFHVLPDIYQQLLDACQSNSTTQKDDLIYQILLLTDQRIWGDPKALHPDLKVVIKQPLESSSAILQGCQVFQIEDWEDIGSSSGTNGYIISNQNLETRQPATRGKGRMLKLRLCAGMLPAECDVIAIEHSPCRELDKIVGIGQKIVVRRAEMRHRILMLSDSTVRLLGGSCFDNDEQKRALSTTNTTMQSIATNSSTTPGSTHNTRPAAVTSSTMTNASAHVIQTPTELTKFPADRSRQSPQAPIDPQIETLSKNDNSGLAHRANTSKSYCTAALPQENKNSVLHDDKLDEDIIFQDLPLDWINDTSNGDQDSAIYIQDTKTEDDQNQVPADEKSTHNSTSVDGAHTFDYELEEPSVQRTLDHQGYNEIISQSDEITSSGSSFNSPGTIHRKHDVSLGCHPLPSSSVISSCSQAAAKCQQARQCGDRQMRIFVSCTIAGVIKKFRFDQGRYELPILLRDARTGQELSVEMDSSLLERLMGVPAEEAHRCITLKSMGGPAERKHLKQRAKQIGNMLRDFQGAVECSICHIGSNDRCLNSESEFEAVAVCFYPNV